MSKRIRPAVEALEPKVALSALAGHPAPSGPVDRGAILHAEASPVVVRGTYVIGGSADRPTVTLTASAFILPKLEAVTITGTEAARGGTSGSAVVNKIQVFNGSTYQLIRVNPGLFFAPGRSGESSHRYDVLPNGALGKGKVDLILRGDSSFTLRFTPD